MLARPVRHIRQQYAGFLALFIALGGVSYAAVTLPANSVGSKQIKREAVKNSDLGKSAVTSGKVRNGSLLGMDFKAGQLPAGAKGAMGSAGAIGPAGAIGSAGAIGATGPTGPAALTGYEQVKTITDSASAQVQASAFCPAEKTVVGGQFIASVGNPAPNVGVIQAVKVLFAGPSSASGYNAGVQFDAVPPAGQFNKLRVTAICVNLAP